jgi:Family of unknown function (DUF6704)
MTNQVGSATTGGSVADPGSGAAASSRGARIAAGASASGAGGEEVVPFVSQVPGTPVSFPSFHGRTVSWVAVSLIMVAFLAGGLALVFEVWWIFWAAVGVAVIGGLMGAGINLFDDWY